MLSRPSSLADLIRQSDNLHPTSRYVGYRFGLWHSRIILPDRQTFRAFSAKLSRIAAFNPPGASAPAHPRFFSADTGHRVGGDNPWQLPHPCNQLHAGILFRWLFRSLSLRPFCLLDSFGWSDRTSQFSLQSLLLQGFQ